MSKKKSKSIFESKGWKIGMKYLYGLGAAVVIVGALFKILHLPGANEALIVGLGTEAVIFFFSAFEPLPAEDEHWEWDKVYPILRADVELTSEDIENAADNGIGGVGGGGGIGGPNVKLDEKDAEKLVEAQKNLPKVFENLAASINGLKTNVDQLADITDATVATNDFASKLKQASGKLDQFNSGFGASVDAIKAFSQSAGDVKAYSDALKGITGNLASLSKVYEAELEESKKHTGQLTQYYGNLSKVFQNLLETSKDTDALRQEVAKLTTNMKSLNTIYGNMLTAMRQG